MVIYVYQIMKEINNIIVANDGYFGIIYITLLGLEGNQVLGTVRRSDGAFFPPNLKDTCEKLAGKGVGMRPFAQRSIDLARKPAATSFT